MHDVKYIDLMRIYNLYMKHFQIGYFFDEMQSKIISECVSDV